MWKTILLAALGIEMAQALQAPYAIPTFATLSNNWPNASEWASLNNSLGGRLQALRPCAAVYYTSDPLYNAEACKTELAGYDNDTYREEIATALLWASRDSESCGFDQGCPLNYSNPQPKVGGATRYQGSTAPYSISIRNAKDASTVVKWATAHNVKLNVNNTGHDCQGRSAASSSLQVNTHRMGNLTYVPGFIPQGSNAAPVPALTIGAGVQNRNIYDFANANGLTPVVWACLIVGAAGGYLQGGGTSVLGPAYGLGVDNVLEFEVVTADGQIRVANEAQNSDLFWAMRGGGAGSWGIITSTTVQVHPSVTIGSSLLTVVPNPSQNMTALGIEFLSLAAKYQNGFTNIGIAVVLFVFEDKYVVLFYWPTSRASLSDLYPFFDELKSHSSNYMVVSNTTSASMFSSTDTTIERNAGPTFESSPFYSAPNKIASRLIPQSYIDPSNPSSITAVSEAIWEGLRIVNGPLESMPAGTLDTAPVVILAGIPGASMSENVNNTGANPALYSASWHVVFSASWTLGVDATTNLKVMTAVHDSVIPLAALGLKSIYQNDGDAFEEDWQEVYFGYKYAELSSIKQKYDPNNFFQSYKGVASVTDLPVYQCYTDKEKELF